MRYFAIFSSLVFLLPNCTPVMSDFPGKYTLTNILDAQKKPLIIPPQRDFSLEIQEIADQPNQFNFYLKIGNMLRSSFRVDNDDSVSFGMVVSTKMFPGQELVNVESAVSRILPSCVRMEKGDFLVFKGNEGELEFKAVQDTEE